MRRRSQSACSSGSGRNLWATEESRDTYDAIDKSLPELRETNLGVRTGDRVGSAHLDGYSSSLQQFTDSQSRPHV